MVLYLAGNDKSPNRKEKLGKFSGISNNKGGALTFWIWTDDTQEIIVRYVISSADDPSNPNEHVATSR